MRGTVAAIFLLCACGGSTGNSSGSTGAPGQPDAPTDAGPPIVVDDAGTITVADAGPADAGAPQQPDAGPVVPPDAGPAAPPDAGPTQTALLHVTIQGKGSVTSDPPGIDCGQTCDAQFAATEVFADSTSITLTPAAAPGWSFSSWQAECAGVECTFKKQTESQNVTAIFIPTPAAPGPSAWSVVEIPTVVGSSGSSFAGTPGGINSLGQVVGSFLDCVSIGMSECVDGPFVGFIYDPALGKTALIEFPGTTDHAANAINDHGVILFSGNPFGEADAVVWDGTKATNFGENTGAGGVNAEGQVAGTGFDAGVQFAFLWDGSKINRIGPDSSFGFGINSSGMVAGGILTGGLQRATVFAGGEAQDLGTLPGGDQSAALAINDSGRVVGRAVASPGSPGGYHAFVFDLPNGPMQDVLPGQSASLVSVNAAGDAVGSTLSISDPDHAILWHAGAVVDLTQALNDPAWQLLSAVSINARGQITGTAMHLGRQAGYVLTPK
jgi:uncharacterized membrane protein